MFVQWLANLDSRVHTRLLDTFKTNAMASRPTVSVHAVSGGSLDIFHPESTLTPSTEASSSLPLPAVLTAPIRLDVVAQVHSMSSH